METFHLKIVKKINYLNDHLLNNKYLFDLLNSCYITSLLNPYALNIHVS